MGAIIQSMTTVYLIFITSFGLGNYLTLMVILTGAVS